MLQPCRTGRTGDRAVPEPLWSGRAGSDRLPPSGWAARRTASCRPTKAASADTARRSDGTPTKAVPLPVRGRLTRSDVCLLCHVKLRDARWRTRPAGPHRRGRAPQRATHTASTSALTLFLKNRDIFFAVHAGKLGGSASDARPRLHLPLPAHRRRSALPRPVPVYRSKAAVSNGSSRTPRSTATRFSFFPYSHSIPRRLTARSPLPRILRPRSVSS